MMPASAMAIVNPDLAVLTLTRGGVLLAGKVERNYPGRVTVYRAGGDGPALKELLPLVWGKYRVIVMIMASGIAVRVIAPFLEDKRRDPAVVVMDEEGKHAVSLVGGHLGGANRLACILADLVGGEAVITTASDVKSLPSIDLVAEELGLFAEPPGGLKAVGSALVNGREVTCLVEETGFELDQALRGRLPGVRFPAPRDAGYAGDCTIVVSAAANPVDASLYLRPRVVGVGLGCRRGVKAEEVTGAVKAALDEAGLAVGSVFALGTVDIKEDEYGMHAAAENMGVPLRFFSRNEIQGLLDQRPDLSRSQIVKEKVGVEGVCEAAALLLGSDMELVSGKKVFGRVTVALARGPWRWSASAPGVRET